MHSLIALAAAALLAAVSASTANAETAGAAGTATQAVTGATSDGGTFSGTMQVQDIVVRDGVVYAVGTIDGTATSADGETSAVAGAPFAAPAQVEQQQEGCTLFSFSIGPIDLNVLGLIIVHIEPIAMEVRLGGLLGTLLCGILGGGTAAPPEPAAVRP